MLEATSATLPADGRNGYTYGSSYEVDRYPADLSAASSHGSGSNSAALNAGPAAGQVSTVIAAIS